MPCNCDHMEPTENEIRLSRIACCIDELSGEEFNKGYWSGYHPLVYTQTYDKYSDAGVGWEYDSLCTLTHSLKVLEDIKIYSLELQMWWRDWNYDVIKSNKYLKKLKEEKEEALSKQSQDYKEQSNAILQAGIEKTRIMNRARELFTPEEIKVIQER